jgi:hypothetical protein
VELSEADFRKQADRVENRRRARLQTGWSLLLFLIAITFSAPAQDIPDNPAPQTNSTDSSSKASAGSNDADPTKPAEKAPDEVPKRIFWIIPNFMTANDDADNKGPLTTKQKYNIAWHQFADESAHFGNVLQAAISQAADGIPHYGQGWGAFGERFLAQEGDQFTGSFLIYGILPQLLHQDPRYFRKGKGSAISRVAYAASRVLIARRDNGNRVFNAAQVFGQLGQAGISLTYYPDQDHDVKGLFLGWAVNQTYNVGWNQLKEFTPDLGAYLKRRAERKREKKAAQQAYFLEGSSTSDSGGN